MEDAAHSPLMRSPSVDDEADIELNSSNQDLEESDLQDPTILLWLLVFSAGISGLLFGYE